MIYHAAFLSGLFLVLRVLHPPRYRSIPAGLVEGLARLIAALASAIPLELGYWLADRAGDLLYLSRLPTRRAIEDTQRHIPPLVGEQKVRARTRRACHNWARAYFDLFRLVRLPDEALAACTEVEGEAYLAEALRGGSGALLVTIHLGVPEVIGRVLALRGYRGCVVVERTRPALLFEVMSRLRTHDALELVPIDRALITLVRTLRRGDIVAVMGDRDLTGSGIVLPFFGQDGHMPVGAVRLAQRTGAPLVVAGCIRLAAGRFRVVLHPPLFVSESLPPEQVVADIVGQLETLIQQAPEQWTVTTSLWGTSPALGDTAQS